MAKKSSKKKEKAKRKKEKAPKDAYDAAVSLLGGVVCTYTVLMIAGIVAAVVLSFLS